MTTGDPRLAESSDESVLDRALGVLGVVGGVALLAAFVPGLGIPADVNVGRLVLVNVGAIAVAMAVARGALGATGTGLRVIAIATMAANGWHLVQTLVGTTVDRPFAGDLGVVYFWAGLAMWLTDGALGLGIVGARLGRPWGPLALGVGSLLAILGMDRLELTSSTDPTIFGPIALTGIALNGLGWILLGLAIVRRARARVASPG